jgi:hypothetical protein
MKPRNPPPYQINVEYGQYQTGNSGGTGGVGASFTISGLQTYVDIPILGMTATGQLGITPLPPTGNIADAVFTQTPGTGTVRISVLTAPGAGNSFNGCYTILRFS